MTGPDSDSIPKIYTRTAQTKISAVTRVRFTKALR
jgi:hypothetical protein